MLRFFSLSLSLSLSLKRERWGFIERNIQKKFKRERETRFNQLIKNTASKQTQLTQHVY